MAGQGQVMYLFAKACRHEPFSEEEISIGNIDRRNVVQLLDDHVQLQETAAPDPPRIKNSPSSQRDRAKESQSKKLQSSSNDCTWTYFSFCRSKLASLKSQATATLPRETNGFVSTDDVLTIYSNEWERIKLKTTLSRNVNVRQHLQIPASYPGFVTNTTLHTFALDEVANHLLGYLSSQLRSALSPESLNQRTRELATRIRRDKNSANATIVPKGNPELDVRLSSWAKENCYNLDFGFGLPLAVRRPRFTDGSREGLVYFLPKAPDGEIVVGICLRRDDMERLKKHQDFAKFGTFLG
ncbi:trichothecene 3-O-acetyltransferase, putative [Talaromyces stipitatus ATCC 10500]|uniref:Trichothecene 3-O-acetyltransferase, putative n=1 Tax=Talaromyces stipitatus (strain ATCC 10500 / CBS 375.48 / QM 6759 / NRRL 1006) TaxID=441959 RepID=B8MJB1_TALSN|nr:trichothecene 3-O-acetyltransferase, putative [Talaromyces stipitatus ATCC 10500]EED14700.1 trichothecene 3-O-acetyltransferase, putative [Talaromyces stipitatus ATCC 10500]